MRADEAQLKAWMIGGLDGNARDHEALLRALAPLLRAFYRRRVASADEIEDIVQDTLIAVHTRRATFDRDRALTAWLFAIARYKMVDHFRRTRRDMPLDEIGDQLLVEGFEDESNAGMDVAELLDRLPAKQAYAIRATRIEGKSVADAAAEAGLGQSDIKVSVHRGLKALTSRIRSMDR